MYLAVAHSKLGEGTAATNERHRALESADTTERFVILATYAERTGAVDIADASYAAILKLMPRAHLAYEGRLRIAMVMGQTAKAHALAVEMVALWPAEEEARLGETYLRLLLGASNPDIQVAEHQAEILSMKYPETGPRERFWDWLGCVWVYGRRFAGILWNERT